MASLAPAPSTSAATEHIATVHHDPGQESLIILQSLLCLMREKNLLSRADVEELCRKVDSRMSGESQAALPCCVDSAQSASGVMHELTSYIGRKYGGKHARS